MLFETFDSVRTHLKTISGIRAIQWYNAQYDGTIYLTPVAYVEFPDRIPLSAATGGVNRVDLMLRIHLASTIVSGQDGTITDNIILDHEALAEQILKALSGKQVKLSDSPTTSLQPAGWQHYQKMKGMLITFVELKATAYLE